MMNGMVNKEFAQEIAAVIRTAQNGDRLPELLKHYHQRDVAKAVTLLTDAERERLFRQLDARTPCVWGTFSSFRRKIAGPGGKEDPGAAV